MRDDTPAPTRRSRRTSPIGRTATSPPWRSGSSTPRPSFVDDYQAVVDDLGVTEADLRADVGRRGREHGSGPLLGDRAARGPRRRVDLGRVAVHRRGRTATGSSSGRPSNIHPELADGQHLALTREVPERAPILDAAGNPLSVGRPARIIGLEPRADPRPEPGQGGVPAAARHRPGRHRRGAQRPRCPTRPLRHHHHHRPGPLRPGRAGHLPAARHPVPRHVPAGRAHPRVRRPRARPLRRDHRRAARGARPALPGGRHGRAERARGALRGAARRHAVEHDPGGRRRTAPWRPTSIGSRARRPEPVRTTIDPAVQSAVEAALGTTTAPTAIVVVDSKSNVRAVASRPLGEFNRALAGEYAPGSTFKIVTTTGLLAQGVTPDTPVECAPDDQRRRTLVPELRAVEPRHRPVRPGVRPVVQHRLHLRRRRHARPRLRGRGRELRLQHRVLRRARHRRRQLPHPGRRHRARGGRHRPGSGDRQPPAHGDGRRIGDRRHLGAAGPAARRAGAERPGAHLPGAPAPTRPCSA